MSDAEAAFYIVKKMGETLSIEVNGNTQTESTYIEAEIIKRIAHANNVIPLAAEARSIQEQLEQQPRAFNSDKTYKKFIQNKGIDMFRALTADEEFYPQAQDAFNVFYKNWMQERIDAANKAMLEAKVA